MYLGIYKIDGDPNGLLAAYDRLIAMMPEGQVVFHACAIRENGITIFDACQPKRCSSSSRPPQSFEAQPRLPDFLGPAGSRGCRFTPYAPKVSKDGLSK